MILFSTFLYGEMKCHLTQRVHATKILHIIDEKEHDVIFGDCQNLKALYRPVN